MPRLTYSHIWRAVPIGEGKIRLLNLFGGEGQDNLEARLVIRETEDAYDALSYTWGREAADGTIRIHYSDRDSVRVPIGRNLESCLRHLRHKEHPRLLWVDALCIDQANTTEKNLQVPRMANVFHEAVNVCVWLGEKTEDSDRAMGFIRRNLDFDRSHTPDDEQGSVVDFQAFCSLMRRPWFGRRWIVQEIALAKAATIHCGETTVPWSDFADAVDLFVSSNRIVQRSHTKPNYLGGIEALGAYRLVRTTNKLFRKSNDGAIMHHLLNLESLVSLLTPFAATKPHDVIYAVLPLAQDTGSRFSTKKQNATAPAKQPAWLDAPHYQHPQASAGAQEKAKSFILKAMRRVADSRFPVNYDKTFFQVCRDFISFVINHSESLDIICRPWAPVDSEEELPSWIGTIADIPFKADSHGRQSRVKADILVGLPFQGKLGNTNYHAALEYPLGKDWRLGHGAEHKSLFVKGFVLDMIKEETGPAWGGVIPQEWLKVGGWVDISDFPPEDFWRTLVADRGPNGENPPDYWKRACQIAFARGMHGEYLNTGDVIAESETSERVVEFLTRVQAVIWMRMLIKTSTHKALGMAPKSAQRRDFMCILYGCSVSVILREHGGDLGRIKSYEFIGACYVDGMTDGAAFMIQHESGIEAQEFELAMPPKEETPSLPPFERSSSSFERLMRRRSA